MTNEIHFNEMILLQQELIYENNKITKPVPRQDSSPDLLLVNQIKK